MIAKRPLSMIAVGIVALAAVIAVVGCGSDDEAGADSGFIEGTVTSGDAKPEAGVWVIAETESLPTNYRKIVVTNDDGKFVLPELPEADYQVWARGYGLLDSAKVDAKAGDSVELTSEVATPQEAAKIYPSNYFLSMFEPPDKSADWMTDFKLTCMLCHQMGSPITRAGTNVDFYEKGLKKSNVMNAGVDATGWRQVHPGAGRLGQADPGRRGPGGDPAAAGGHRAQHRGLPVGVR